MISNLFRRSAVLLCTARRSAEEESSVKSQVEATLEKHKQAMARIAIYPHRILTRPVLPVSPDAIPRPLFSSRLMDLTKMAQDLNCVSFSAPKGHWDAAVVLIKSDPTQENYEVWVNPEVPNYDDPHSVAPMYGMWENCVSCGSTSAWVIRPQRITCRGYDEHGVEKVDVLEGMRARGLMHELDHIKGKTIIQRALDPQFIVSMSAGLQRDLWPVNYPSAEAYVTGECQFFDYVKNTTIVPPGLEFWYSQNMQAQQFSTMERIQH